MKKAQVTIFIIIAVVLVSALVLLSWLQAKETPEIEQRECETDADCAPIGCCNTEFCGPISEMVSCNFSNFDCQPGCETELLSGELKLGCGLPEKRGSCLCQNNNCIPVYPN